MTDGESHSRIARKFFSPAIFVLSLAVLLGPWFITDYLVDTHTNLAGLFGALATWAIWFVLAGVASTLAIITISISAWFASNSKGKMVGAEMKEEGYPAGPSALIASAMVDELDETDGAEVKDDG